MGIISRLLGRRQRSRETAKQRLRMVLVHDRSGIPPELLNVIRSDIITVISKHVVVDREATEIRLAHEQGRTTLEANIPIGKLRQAETGGQANITQF